MGNAPKTKNPYAKNKFMFGLGTVGRDMVYTLVSMYFMVYLTGVVGVEDATLGILTGFLVTFRILDALYDPFMGAVVDSTRTRWGKFKPWILIGMASAGLVVIMLFSDFGLSSDGAAFIAVTALLYLFWGITFSVNDLSYWSMLPSLSQDQKEREKIGSVARICANVGLFSVVVAIVPLTEALAKATGSLRTGYFVFALILVCIMWAFQLFTIFGVKEPKVKRVSTEKTGFKDIFKALIKNDQLLITAIAMVLFMTGYTTTTSIAIYFFKYVFKDENMYMVFAAILGVAQITALALFPVFSKRFSRRQLYIISMIGVAAGYLLFFATPLGPGTGNLIMMGAGALLLFFAQAIIQLLMLVFLADTVEYGEWKLGKRNESVTFAVQPLINQLSGALANGIMGAALIITGINGIERAITELGNLPDPAEVSALINSFSALGAWGLKAAMQIIPLIMIAAGFVLYFFKFKIDKKKYDEIIKDLAERNRPADTAGN